MREDSAKIDIDFLSLWNNRFEMVRLLGAGNTARVYEVYDRAVSRSIALKVFTDSLVLELSTREFRSVCNLHHPNLVQLYHLTIEGPVAAIGMELYDRSLQDDDYCNNSIPDVDGLAHLEESLIKGLSALHSASVIHGDIKPSNVLVYGDRIALADFGLSRRVDSSVLGPISGTPAYMAPEIFRGSPPSPQSDLFSLAMLLLVCASGEQPVFGYGSDGPYLKHPWLGKTELLQRAFPKKWHRIGRFLDPVPENRGSLLPSMSRAKSAEPPKRWSSNISIMLNWENQVRSTREMVRIDVVGTSSIERSRLIHETSKRVRGLSLLVSCHPQQAVPFATLDSLLEQLAEVGLRRVSDEAARLRGALFEARDQIDSKGGLIREIANLIEQITSLDGLVVFIDNAQWSDEGSGRMLSAIFGDLACAMLVVFAYRADVLPKSLVDWLPDQTLFLE